MFAGILPDDLPDKVARWGSLKRWERRELGQELRRLGLSYREIRQMIPVPKGTLSGWCRDMPLSPNQLDALRDRAGHGEVARARVGEVLRSRNLKRIGKIRGHARKEAERLKDDAFWVAGIVAYWGEGTKRKGVQFSNSDPALVTLFIEWACKYFELDIDDFTISLHIHSGQSEEDLRDYWANLTGLPLGAFRKGFVKPEGTGHRKNILYNGTAQVRVRRSTDILHRILGWIDCISEASWQTDTL